MSIIIATNLCYVSSCNSLNLGKLITYLLQFSFKTWVKLHHNHEVAVQGNHSVFTEPQWLAAETGLMALAGQSGVNYRRITQSKWVMKLSMHNATIVASPLMDRSVPRLPRWRSLEYKAVERPTLLTEIAAGLGNGFKAVLIFLEYLIVFPLHTNLQDFST